MVFRGGGSGRWLVLDKVIKWSRMTEVRCHYEEKRKTTGCRGTPRLCILESPWGHVKKTGSTCLDLWPPELKPQTHLFLNCSHSVILCYQQDEITNRETFGKKMMNVLGHTPDQMDYNPSKCDWSIMISFQLLKWLQNRPTMVTSALDPQTGLKQKLLVEVFILCLQ